MPKKLAENIRQRVVEYWILGHSYEEIAKKLGVSQGSARNFVDELKEGRFPQYASFLAYLDDLRRLVQLLRAKNLSLEQAVTGISIFTALSQLDIEPSRLQELYQLLQRASPPDFPIQQFAKAALHLEAVEKQTGQSFAELDNRLGNLLPEITSLGKKKKELEETVSSLEAAKENAQKTLMRQLEDNKTTSQALEQYSKDREALAKAGVNLNDINATANLIRKAIAEGVLATVRELFTLQSATGKDHTALLLEYRQVKTLTENHRLESKRLEWEIGRSKLETARLQQEESEQLARKQLTEERLNRYLAFQERIAALGISFEKLEALERILAEVERLGWRASEVITYIQQIRGLEQRKQQALAELSSAEKDLAVARNTLQVTLGQADAARREVATLQGVEAETQTELTQIREQVERQKLRIDLAQIFVSLLLEPPSAKDDQILTLIETLQLILEARRQRPGLLIDYKLLQAEFLDLLETVGGKRLVPRDTLEEQLTIIKNKYTDLLLGRLSKLEEEKNKVRKDKEELDSRMAELEKLMQEFKEASREKFLAAYAERHGGRFVHSYLCERCGSAFAYELGTEKYPNHPISCPFCMVGRLTRYRKFSPQEQVA